MSRFLKIVEYVSLPHRFHFRCIGLSERDADDISKHCFFSSYPFRLRRVADLPFTQTFMFAPLAPKRPVDELSVSVVVSVHLAALHVVFEKHVAVTLEPMYRKSSRHISVLSMFPMVTCLSICSTVFRGGIDCYLGCMCGRHLSRP